MPTGGLYGLGGFQKLSFAGMGGLTGGLLVLAGAGRGFESPPLGAGAVAILAYLFVIYVHPINTPRVLGETVFTRHSVRFR